jgi:hypothetical protein
VRLFKIVIQLYIKGTRGTTGDLGNISADIFRVEIVFICQVSADKLDGELF